MELPSHTSNVFSRMQNEGATALARCSIEHAGGRMDDADSRPIRPQPAAEDDDGIDDDDDDVIVVGSWSWSWSSSPAVGTDERPARPLLLRRWMRATSISEASRSAFFRFSTSETLSGVSCWVSASLSPPSLCSVPSSLPITGIHASWRRA